MEFGQLDLDDNLVIFECILVLFGMSWQLGLIPLPLPPFVSKLVAPFGKSTGSVQSEGWLKSVDKMLTEARHGHFENIATGFRGILVCIDFDWCQTCVYFVTLSSSRAFLLAQASNQDLHFER